MKKLVALILAALLLASCALAEGTASPYVGGWILYRSSSETSANFEYLQLFGDGVAYFMRQALRSPDGVAYESDWHGTWETVKTGIRITIAQKNGASYYFARVGDYLIELDNTLGHPRVFTRLEQVTVP